MNYNDAVFELSAGKSSQLPASDLPEIVFSGKSNVGKSSLINKLVNRKSLARVSSTPGKTATINFFNIGNNSFRLVDLPGYGYAKVSKTEKSRWAELVEGYFADDRNFCLVIQLVDMRHKPTEDDINMIRFLCDCEMPFILALTKKDKLKKTQQEKRLEELKEELYDFEGLKMIPFSAVNRDGLDEIKACIEEAVNDFNAYLDELDEGCEKDVL